MTPAERLRTAADVIERTAAPASPGPWEAYTDGDVLTANGSTCISVGAAGGVEQEAADAAWIALLGPDTAPDLAAWLRATADDAAQVDRINAAALERAERVGGDGHTFAMYHALTTPALAFADRILRREQVTP